MKVDVSFGRSACFYADASEAVFLFDEPIQEHVDTLYEKAIDLHTLHEQMYPSGKSAGLPPGDERSKVARDSAEMRKWFAKQLPATKTLFGKYMAVR